MAAIETVIYINPLLGEYKTSWVNSLPKGLQDGEELPPLPRFIPVPEIKYSSCQGLAAVFVSHLKEEGAPFQNSTQKSWLFFTKRKAAISWLQSRVSSTLTTC